MVMVLGFGERFVRELERRRGGDGIVVLLLLLRGGLGVCSRCCFCDWGVDTARGRVFAAVWAT